MLLVFPFCRTDAKLAIALAKYFQYLGPYKQHDILLACPDNAADKLEEIQEAFGEQFAKVYTFHPKIYQDGWPVGPNCMFHAITNHVAQSINCKCWYMYEPDNTPIKPGWLNTLAVEYDRTARPFMGVIHATYWKRRDGSFYQDGSHLTGSSIYPKDAPRYSTLFRTIPTCGQPWDVYWQWEIVKFAASTNLIHHEWRSFNYRRDKKTGEILGDRQAGSLPPEINTPLPLRPDAVTHHGCKDGSLMQIMRGFFTARKEGIAEEPVSV